MSQRFPWRQFSSELIGTALLVLVGLSLVIVMFGTGSPMARLIPSEGLRRLITGFLFGTTGAAIALSAVGKESGAHINPVVTMAFWLFRRLDSRMAMIYVSAQLVGATIGSLPLLVWGSMGRSVVFGATLPGAGWSTQAVLLGEVVTTFTMVSLLTVFVGFRRTSSVHSGDFPDSVCDHGLSRVADLGHQHESRSQPGSGDRVRAVARVVDLLGGSNDRCLPGHPGLQFPREANHRGQALPF